MNISIKIFIKKIVAIYLIVILISFTLYFFSRHNIITDYTASMYVTNFSKNPISVKKEIAEERRVVVQNIIRNKNNHFKHLIIGSSRVMQFGSLTGFKNSLNLGVSGANLIDIKYIYELTKEYNITYDTIIFDFNPWLTFNGNDLRYKQFSTFHRIKHAVYDIVKFNYNLQDLITILGIFDNYSRSFKVAQKEEIKHRSHFIKNTDGSIQYKALSLHHRINKIRSFSAVLYQMNTFNTINYKMLHETIKLYNNASINGTCFVTLTPFHMEMYKQNKGDIRIENINKVEVALKNSKHSFEIYGSFEPTSINVKNDDFYDGLHLKEWAVHKIFNNKNYSKLN